MNGAELQMKHNGHLTFQYVFDYWSTHFIDARLFYGMPDVIVSFDVVHVDSVVIIMLFKK